MTFNLYRLRWQGQHTIQPRRRRCQMLRAEVRIARGHAHIGVAEQLLNVVQVDNVGNTTAEKDTAGKQIVRQSFVHALWSEMSLVRNLPVEPKRFHFRSIASRGSGFSLL